MKLSFTQANIKMTHPIATTAEQDRSQITDMPHIPHQIANQESTIFYTKW